MDIIFALNDDSNNLLDFELFIHHRAYRKLAWRVLEFSTHWGEPPFDILVKHLDPNLQPKHFTLNTTAQAVIQSFTIPPTSQSDLGLVYTVNVNNTSTWVRNLKGFWDRLEGHLLVDNPKKAKKMIREDSPKPQAVEDIVSVITLLESTMHIFSYLLSGDDAARALAHAGELNSLFPFQAF